MVEVTRDNLYAIAKKVIAEVIDKGMQRSTFRELFPEAFNELLVYRPDMERDVVRVLKRELEKTNSYVSSFGPFFHFNGEYGIWSRVLRQTREPVEDVHTSRGHVIEVDLQPLYDTPAGWETIKKLDYRRYTGFHRPEQGDVYSTKCPPEVYAMMILNIGQALADIMIEMELGGTNGTNQRTD